VVIHSRMTESFVSLDDRYLKMITEKLIGMPDFDTVIERVKDGVRDTESKIDSLQSRMIWDVKAIKNKLDELARYKKLSKQHEKEQREKLADRQKQLKEQEESIAAAKEDEARYGKKTSRAAKKLVEVTEWIKKVDKKLKAAADVGVTAHTEVVKLTTRIEALTKLKNKYKTMSGNTCPECGQKVSVDHIKAKIRATDIEFNALLLERSKRNLFYESCKTACNGLATTYKRLDKEKDSTNTKLYEYKSKLENAVNRVRTYRRVLEKLKAYDEKHQEENAYIKLIADARKAIAKLKVDTELNKIKQNKLKKRLQYYEFWRKGFGPSGIRSFVLDAVTPVINRYANIYLNFLTDGQMHVELDTRKKNKDGTFADKFSVRIENLSGSSRLGGGSDGELASVDLAVNFAMSDLLDARIPGGMGFMLIDQAIDLLDTARGRKAIQLLNSKLNPKWCEENKVPCKRSIWLTTHREQFKGLIENRIQVQKIGKVCSIVGG
jgi:DNA repair exonuclease SbcCD ATPase subunit